MQETLSLADKNLSQFKTMHKADTFSYRLVVATLAGAVAISLGSGMTLAVMGKPIPEIFIVIGSNAIGAISGLLAPSPNQKEDA